MPPVDPAGWAWRRISCAGLAGRWQSGFFPINPHTEILPESANDGYGLANVRSMSENMLQSS